MDRAVLVVDDVPVFLSFHTNVLKGCELEVVTASNLDELAAKYGEYRDRLDAVIVDGRLKGDKLNTLSFISRVKHDIDTGKFSGILVAASTREDYRKQMLAAGCTHEAPKEHAAQLVRDELFPQS